MPYEINNGDCDRFADAVCSKVKGTEVRITEFEDEFEGYHWVGHFWVEYKGKHYDAECPDGVDNFLDLPIFQKAKVKKGLEDWR